MHLGPDAKNDVTSLVLFLSVSTQWLHINLTYPGTADKLDSIGDHIPLLRSLVLQKTMGTPYPFRAFAHAPGLRIVTIISGSGNNSLTSLSAIHIPVRQIFYNCVQAGHENLEVLVILSSIPLLG